MKTRKLLVFEIFLWLGLFITFGGYYSLLIFYAEVIGSIQTSRALTIPLRVVIVALLFIACFLGPRKKIARTNIALVFFGIFSALYISLLILEIIEGPSENYAWPVWNFLAYFTSFVLLPFFFVSVLKLTTSTSSKMYYAVLVSCVLFCVLGVIFYSEFIGASVRINPRVHENAVSPLALSYTSAIAIGLLLIPWVDPNDRSGSLKKICHAGAILVCLIPFFLGASRGAILALGLPFLFFIGITKGINKLYIIMVLVLGCLLIIFMQDYLGYVLLDRFLGIVDAVNVENGEASRLRLWRASWEQFVSSPIYGGSLGVELYETSFYAHNIFFDVALATGLLGFIPFVTFVIIVIRKSIMMLTLPEGGGIWIVIIFLQSLIQNCFSGGIYNAAWFAVSAALVLAFQPPPIGRSIPWVKNRMPNRYGYSV